MRQRAKTRGLAEPLGAGTNGVPLKFAALLNPSLTQVKHGMANAHVKWEQIAGCLAFPNSLNWQNITQTI